VNEKIIVFETESSGKHNLIIENLENCEVYVLFNFKACYIKNLKKCKVYIGSINGGAHINDCDDCSIYIATHQLRIHKTHNSCFSIISSSNPIIEDCSKLTFSPLNINYKEKENLLKAAGLTVEKNKWNVVYDFKWHKKEKSPNYDYIDNNRIIEIDL